ncbi:MAG: SGNH/GDSL hydrolase family protein [Bacteroidales bacterium]|nr:SGNH/GDSL hydrolase family protein [Bacteroidales bacterium]
MKGYTYEITLDINESQSPITLPIKKGDRNRSVCFSLTKGAEPYVLEEGTIACVEAKKNGATFFGYCAVIENKIICDLSKVVSTDGLTSLVAAEGVADCEVKITHSVNSEVTSVASTRFTVLVDSRVIDSNEEVKYTEIPYEAFKESVSNYLTAEENRAKAEEARQATFEENEAERKTTFDTNEANRQAEFKSGEAARETSCQDIPLTDDMLKDGCYTQDYSGFNATTLYGFKTYEREVKEGERYYVHGYTLTVICLYTLFNNNGKHSWFPNQNVGGIESNPVEQSAIVEIPEGVTKLAYSFIGSRPHTIKKLPICDIGKVEKLARETATNTVNEQKLSVNVFKNKNNLINYLDNVLFIGDSLTAGYYHNGTKWTVTERNYPYFFSRIAHVSPTVVAESGITTMGWFEKYANTINYADYDSVIVWLGTNGGLTENSSTGTNTDCYYKIIDKMIADNPNILIFLGNVYVTGGENRASVTETNDTIATIATLEKYSKNIVGVIDNNDGALFSNTNDLYHPFKPVGSFNGDTIHFGIVGNLHLAEHWAEGICNLLVENESVCERLYLMPTSNAILDEISALIGGAE